MSSCEVSAVVQVLVRLPNIKLKLSSRNNDAQTGWVGVFRLFVADKGGKEGRKEENCMRLSYVPETII
jgi:hypothetical protein